ncbi:MAG: hypothetical protein IKK33_13905 [Lachnospiraceae bacterium]|nr:hypothetical protein [Lachnospiraceae bacterium]
MNKSLTTLFIFLLSTLLSFPVHASENTMISDGYTSNGIYYTVYELETDTISSRAVGDTIEVLREFHYSGIIAPPSPVTWTEIHNGITYTGSLKLYNFYIKDGNTIAAYKGTLTAIE